MENINLKYNEGLGTVYERFMLNNYFENIIKKEKIEKVLECPFYGMSGLTGINSVFFAQNGCEVTLIDHDKEYIEEAEYLWKDIGLNNFLETLVIDFSSKLPFEDEYFDLVWNFAALWHWDNTDELVNELCRVSKKYVYIAMPNSKQIGYFLRKYWLDKDFFNNIDETWMDLKICKKIIEKKGFKIIDQGVLDIPPWPDTCMPIKELLNKLGINITPNKVSDNNWNWNIMAYFKGEDYSLKRKVDKYTIIERLPVPWQLKKIWAHHCYILCERQK